MFSSTASAEFKKSLRKFSNLKREEYGEYAYTAGYFESLLADMFGRLSKADQKTYARQIELEVAKIQQLSG